MVQLPETVLVAPKKLKQGLTIKSINPTPR